MQEDHTIPLGLCQCGCGQRTTVPAGTDRRWNRIKGVPMRYVQGHNPRIDPERYSVDPETGCWVWPSLDHIGYPDRITRDGISKRAHVFFYEQRFGSVPDGLELDHLCRNRGCVNPDHLEAVTHTENMRRSQQAKLTPEDVAEIRSLFGVMKQTAIAKRFGVRHATINHIATGRNWRD